MPKKRTKDEERLYKRKLRARLYAKGLTSKGAPMRYPNRSNRSVHPEGCQCYDCLWAEYKAEWHKKSYSARTIEGRRYTGEGNNL